MKKTIAIVLTVMFIICATLSLVGCTSNSLLCDPRGKEWYNYATYPSIYDPFVEIYDGSYSIKIDKNGNVEFKLLTGEVWKGVLTVSFDGVSAIWKAKISIEFENGDKARGWCERDIYGRYLYFYTYDEYSHGIKYEFSDKVQCTKEEMGVYRSQFVEFLINVYETGVFPTKEEIANNELYRKFTDYSQIDPHHGGPSRYAIVERAIIQDILTQNDRTSIVVNMNGETVDCKVDYDVTVQCYEIKGGTIREIEVEDVSDIKKEECLISINKSYSCDAYGNEEITYHITDIFYVE